MRISDLLTLPRVRWIWLMAAAVLAGCSGSNGPAPKSVTVGVGDQSMVLAAPGALCVDPGSVRTNSAGAFALLDDCAALGPIKRGIVQPASNGLITVSLSPGPISRPGESAEDGLASLRAFLSGPGRPALARNGMAEKVKVQASSIEDEILLLNILDPGPQAVPRLSRRFWRGYKQVNGQTVSASLSTFTSGGSQANARALLKSILQQIDAANPTPEPSNPLESVLQTLGVGGANNATEDTTDNPATPDAQEG